jgi:hypothetical protein
MQRLIGAAVKVVQWECTLSEKPKQDSGPYTVARSMGGSIEFLATDVATIGLPVEAVALIGAGTLTADASVLPDWASARAEMIGWLDAIEEGFQKIRPFLETVEAGYRERTAQIGHNNPPEPIEILPLNTAELEMGAAAANLARAELNAEHPRFDVIRLCGLVLNDMAARVFACLQWIGAKGEPYLDAFLKSAAAEAGKRVVQGVTVVGTGAALMAIITQSHVNLTHAATTLRHIVEFMHL